MGIEALLLSQVITISGATGQVATKQADGSLALQDAPVATGGTVGELVFAANTELEARDAIGLNTTDSPAFAGGTFSGNVGIGTATPSTYAGGGLTLGTTAAGKSLILYSSIPGENGIVHFIDQNNNNAFQFTATDSSIVLYGFGARPMHLVTNDAIQATITNGAVGIGNITPSTFAGGGLTLGTTAAGKSLHLYSSSDGANGIIQFVDLNGANSLQISGGTTQNTFYGYGARSMVFVTSDAVQMTIASGGAVSFVKPTLLGPYTFATIPSAAANTGGTIRITDRSQRLATSDGTNWNWAGTTTAIS